MNPMQETAAPNVPYDLNRIRRDFPILEQKVNGKPLCFLDSAASSQKPVQVIEAIQNYYLHHHANVHRGVYQLSQEATDLFEQGRRAAQQFIGAGAEREIIFVRGATEGINLVADTFGRAFLKPGDEVLVTWMEHHANIIPWQFACERTGAKLKAVPITDQGELELDTLARMLDGPVKIVAVTHVSNTLGTINPIRQIVRMAHERNIPVLVDGAQSIPHISVDVQYLDADFYTFSGHKMYGPTGIGILYGKEAWLEKLPPYHGGGEMINRVTFEKTTFNELPYRFEAGTPNIEGSIGLKAAIDYMQSIGVDAIALHEEKLTHYGMELLQRIKGLRLIGTAPEKAGVISFVIEDTHPYDLGVLLDKMGIAVRTGHHCTQPLMDRYKIPGTVRASMGMYNTREEIEYLAEAVQIAANLLI